MFFGADIQITVKLTKFKNISIKQPSTLQLRLSISHTSLYKQNISAIPISTIPLTYETSSNTKSQLNHFDNTYVSGKIPILFQDCTISLNEICLFKTTVDVMQFNQQKEIPFIILFQLLLAESDNMKPLITYQAETKSLFQCGYLPVLFDNLQGKYTSSIEVQLQSQLLGFKFYENTAAVKKLYQKKKQIKIMPMEFKQFKDFLKFATKQYKREEVENFYEKYAGCLRRAVSSLKSQIKSFIQFFDKTNQCHLLMGITRKLSQPLPEPRNYSSNNSKFKIFQPILESNSLKSLFTLNKKKEQFNLSPKILEESILKDLNLLNKFLCDLWGQYIKLISQYSNPLFSNNLKKKHFADLKKYFLSNNSLIQGYKFNHYPLSIQAYIRTQNMHHITPNIFKINKFKRNQRKKHLIVLVHGFQACSIDMQILQVMILHMFPNCQLLMSSTNQNRTEKSIEFLGERLALQVKNYINSQDNPDYKISFIAHSLGGIIVRAALQFLMYYKDRFGVYVSLSSPHLGYLFHTSMLIKTSLWLLNKMNKCLSLMELTFQDVNDLESSYLFKLSSKPGLQYFETIVLQSSTLDQYVPYSSARIEMCDQAQNSPNNPNSSIYKKMISNMMHNVNQDKVVRINIEFSNLERDFNSMIGRTAHIQLLSDHQALKAFLMLISDVFI